MSAINFHTKEIGVKIVYYGPGLCGKTTSLQTIYRSLPEAGRPQLVSLATDVDRTIFFDFLPVTAYRIRDFKVRLQLYTVPGQVFYNATRKLVLNGVDGIVFVADSQRAMQDSNLESMQNLSENLSELGLDIDKVPMVMQLNKRDLPDILPVAEMDRLYNARQVPVFATVATTGEGLFDALKVLSGIVVNDLIRKGMGSQIRDPAAAGAAPPPPAEASPPDTLARGIVSAAEAVQPTARGSLWPAGDAGRLGAELEEAIARAQWGRALTACERLLDLGMRRAAGSEGLAGEGGLAAFVFLRGVSPARYRALCQSTQAARAGRPVTHADVMNALIVVLESLW